jgi:hypothetical protein
MKRLATAMILLGAAFTLTIEVLLIEPVGAQENETLQLRQRVGELELKVKQLEDLLKECSEARKLEDANKYGWQNKKNWRKLSVGMKENQVKGILGDPSKVIQGVKTLWYYPNIYGGYVTFDDNGRLVGWNEP